MKKTDILILSKLLAKEYFRLYLEDYNKSLTILDDDIIVMGLKEFDDKYIILLSLPKLLDHYCEITFDKDNKKFLKTNMFQKINL